MVFLLTSPLSLSILRTGQRFYDSGSTIVIITHDASLTDQPDRIAKLQQRLRTWVSGLEQDHSMSALSLGRCFNAQAPRMKVMIMQTALSANIMAYPWGMSTMVPQKRAAKAEAKTPTI